MLTFFSNFSTLHDCILISSQNSLPIFHYISLFINKTCPDFITVPRLALSQSCPFWYIGIIFFNHLKNYSFKPIIFLFFLFLHNFAHIFFCFKKITLLHTLCMFACNMLFYNYWVIFFPQWLQLVLLTGPPIFHSVIMYSLPSFGTKQCSITRVRKLLSQIFRKFDNMLALAV